MEIGCKLAVLGTAVACTLTGSVAGFGPVKAAAIVGYSPDEQLVHWTEILDRRVPRPQRKWKGDTIEFEPLVYTVLGKKSTERFTLSFPSRGRLILKSITETVENLSSITG